MFHNIPAELRVLPQWCVWRYEQLPGADKPTKPLYDPRNGWHAKSTDPDTWVNFDHAVSAVASGVYNGIGFVLSESDPYTFIDLDTYDPKLTKEDKERHAKIANAFQGYAELSPSGAGLHLVIKGKIAAGRKRAGIEMYSAQRYMTMTGNVWRDQPIIEQQELLQTLWEELAPTNNTILTLDNLPQTEDDKTVCDKAYAAFNGEKFAALYAGRWQGVYTSQSEADFALVDIIAYYTKNREQIARIFRGSALGQRTKAQRSDYMDRMLNRAFDNQPPPINFDALKANVEASLSAISQPAIIEKPPANEVYSVPPGLLGEIAQYIYSAAPRQVPEIALCGAMGLMAGICGRSYNIGGTGLNHYLLLLAPTGSGKESIATGIATLMSEVQKSVPASQDFIGPGEIRSDAALLKYLAKKSASFVTVGGEFGHTLAQMSALNGSSHIKAIKRVMLDLYGKSGAGAVLRPTIYSDTQNNTLAINSPAFTFVGESAPESFFNSVDEALIADGLLPRFTMIEYTGNQPPLNPNRNQPPSPQLVSNVAAVCAQSLNLNNAGKVIDIQLAPDAAQLLDRFEETTRAKINAPDNKEVTRHIWNRAHLRAMKLAGLVAVGENAFQPYVTLAAAQWAIKLSQHNTQRLLDRFDRGDIGNIATDDKQTREVIRMIKKYMRSEYKDSNKSPALKMMHEQKVIPFGYIQNNLVATAAFRTARLGATNAIRNSIKILCSNGDIILIEKQQAYSRFGSTAECYAIGNAALLGDL